MSIPKEAQKVTAIVRVNIAASDEPAEWVTGVIEQVTPRPTGIYGAAIKVDLRPHGAGSTVRYANAGRIELANDVQCHNFALARTKAGLMGQVRVATPSLTTQVPAGDTSMTEVPSTEHQNVQTVTLRVTKGGDFTKLKQVQLDALFSHPQVVGCVNELFKDGADQIVGKHQALEFKATALEGANRSLAEDLELARTSLKSCDTERRALMQKEAQQAGEINRLKDSLANAQRAVLLSERELAKCRTGAPASHLIHIQQAGVGRGFILWCPTASQAPQKVYPTYAKAAEVQEIMAQRNKEQVFHILPIGPGLMYKQPTKAQRCVC